MDFQLDDDIKMEMWITSYSGLIGERLCPVIQEDDVWIHRVEPGLAIGTASQTLRTFNIRRIGDESERDTEKRKINHI